MPRRDPRPRRAPARAGRWWLVALVVGLPILVLVVALAQRTWYPTGDLAQAELRMRSLPDRVPLLGAAGRIVDEQGRQGHHPGPLMFWVTWPLYALLGRSSWAFEAATALVNLAWLTVTVALVRRRAGDAVCAWWGAVALVALGGLGLNALSQPWNPWVALLPFAALVLAAWSAWERDRWAPVLAVAAGSYALQGHVGYAPLVLPLVAFSLLLPAWRWWAVRRAGQRDASNPGGEDRSDDDAAAGSGRSLLVPLLAAVAVGVVAWSGPLADLVVNDPTNVDKLVANFGSPSEEPIGLGRAVEAVLQSSNPTGAWVVARDEVSGSVLPGLAFLAAWAAVALLVARRRAAPHLARLDAVLAALNVLAVVAVSRVFGALYLYVFRWIVVLVALEVFTLGWGAAVLLRSHVAGRVVRPRVAVAGAAVVLVALSALTSVRLVRAEIPYDQSWRMERALAPQVADRLDPDRRYLVRWEDPAYLGGLGFGLVLDLERRGFDVGAEPRFSAAVERHRVRCPGGYDAVVTVVTGPGNVERWDRRPGTERIAHVDPRPDPEAYDRTFRQLQEELAERGSDLDDQQLEQALNLLLLSTDQPEAVRDLAGELVLGGVPSAVYLEDPAPPAGPVPRTPLEEPCWK